MKIKSFLVLIIIFISIFIIYICNKDTKVYYLNITDNKTDSFYSNEIKKYYKKKNKLEKYYSYSKNSDYRITDLIRDINDNIKIDDNQTIQNALIKADILTLSMGNSELNYKINNVEINELFDYCDELLNDLEKLFILIRKYSKEEIYFIGLYNTHSAYYDEIYNYLNLKIEDLSNVYKIKFINIKQINKSDQKKIINQIITQK